MFVRFGFMDSLDAPTFKVDRKTVERMAIAIHVNAFEELGDRYATEAEMNMLLDDPCCEWSLVREKIEYTLGGEFVTCDSDSFTFREYFKVVR